MMEQLAGLKGFFFSEMEIRDFRLRSWNFWDRLNPVPNLPGSFGVLGNFSNFGATIDAEGVRGSALTTRALGI